MSMYNESILNECEALLQAVNLKKRHLMSFSSEYFTYMKSRIKMQQEYLKDICDKKALKLIGQVDKCEEMILEKIATNEFIQILKFDNEEDLKSAKLDLENRLCALNSIEFDIEKISFEPKLVDYNSNDLGALNLNSPIPLVICSFDSALETFNLNSGKCLGTLSGHTSYVTGIKQISNTEIATSSNDCTVKVWNFKTGQCVKSLDEHKSWVSCIKFLRNGDQQLIISGSGDNSIKVI